MAVSEAPTQQQAPLPPEAGAAQAPPTTTGTSTTATRQSSWRTLTDRVEARFPQDQDMQRRILSQVASYVNVTDPQGEEGVEQQLISSGGLTSMMDQVSSETLGTREQANDANFTKAYTNLFLNPMDAQIALADAQGATTRSADLKLTKSLLANSRFGLYEQFKTWAASQTRPLQGAGPPSYTPDLPTDPYGDQMQASLAKFFQSTSPNFLGFIRPDLHGSQTAADITNAVMASALQVSAQLRQEGATATAFHKRMDALMAKAMDLANAEQFDKDQTTRTAIFDGLAHITNTMDQLTKGVIGDPLTGAPPQDPFQAAESIVAGVLDTGLAGSKYAGVAGSSASQITTKFGQQVNLESKLKDLDSAASRLGLTPQQLQTAKNLLTSGSAANPNMTAQDALAQVQTTQGIKPGQGSSDPAAIAAAGGTQVGNPNIPIVTDPKTGQAVDLSDPTARANAKTKNDENAAQLAQQAAGANATLAKAQTRQDYFNLLRARIAGLNPRVRSQYMDADGNFTVDGLNKLNQAIADAGNNPTQAHQVVSTTLDNAEKRAGVTDKLAPTAEHISKVSGISISPEDYQAALEKSGLKPGEQAETPGGSPRTIGVMPTIRSTQSGYNTNDEMAFNAHMDELAKTDIGKQLTNGGQSGDEGFIRYRQQAYQDQTQRAPSDPELGRQGHDPRLDEKRVLTVAAGG